MGLGRKQVATGRRKRDEEDNIDLFQTGFQKASGAKLDAKTVKTTSKRKKESLTEAEAMPEESAFLTEEEQRSVSKRPTTVTPSIANTHASLIRAHNLPRKVPPNTQASKRMLGTSARSASLYSALRAGQELSADSDKNKAWEIETYSAFKSSNVRWWPETRVGTGKDRTFQLLARCDVASVDSAPPAVQGAHPPPAAPLPAAMHTASAANIDNDSSGDELPDLSLITTRSSRASLASPTNHTQSKVYSSNVPKSEVRATPGKGKGRAGASNQSAQDSPRVSAAAMAQVAAVDQTIITIDDSEDDLDVYEAPAVGAPGTAAALSPVATGPKNDHPVLSDAAIDLDDSFDEDLDSSAWLAIDLGPRRGSPEKARVDERARPVSPQMNTIVRLPSLSNDNAKANTCFRLDQVRSSDRRRACLPKMRMTRLLLLEEHPGKEERSLCLAQRRAEWTRISPQRFPIRTTLKMSQ